MVQNQAKIQKIRIVTHFPQEPVLITGNASLLQQVFMNLFLNAIRAMPNGGSLTLFIERNLKEVLIQIADTGGGISKINLENIFDPFYTTSPVGQGTGLGLSICYSIIKQHFGSIEVESLEGKGSTFTVRFPALL
jgi:signal transduction histidine kinase